MKNTHLAEGFRGQILHFTSAALRAELARHSLGSGLHVPDFGWFPRARQHYRERPCGADEHILIYCHSGGGWAEIDGQIQAVSRGQVLLIPRGKPHRYGADETRPWSIYWAHFAGTTAAVYASRFFPSRYLLAVSPLVGQQIQRLFRECYQALPGGGDLRSLLYVAHTFRHLLGVLLFGKSACQEGGPAFSAHDFTSNIEFMQSHLSRTLNLRDLARQAGLSIPRYSALFRARIGTSPVDHHIRLRIQATCRLLITTVLSVKEISDRFGYQDVYYFSRVFRRTMGVSPTKYRRDAKG